MVEDDHRKKLAHQRHGRVLSSIGGWRIDFASTASDPGARKQSNPRRQSMRARPQTWRAVVGKIPCRASRPAKYQATRSGRKWQITACGLAAPYSDQAKHRRTRVAEQ